jgi:subtilisin family serine protease
MRVKKNFVFMISLVLMMVSSQLVMGSSFNNYEEYNYDRLKQMAVKKGHVDVIVKMDVPDIEELTAISTNFKTGGMYAEETYRQAAFNADLKLGQAISNTKDAVLHQLNGKPYKINRTFSSIPYLALGVSPEALETLKTIPEILDIEEDRLIPLPEPLEIESSGDMSQPLLNDSVAVIGADVAWSLGFSGQGQYVAVLDTGLLTSHEMFKGKHIVEHCFARGRNFFDLENGGCPNGGIEMSGPGSAAHYAPQYGHGTHVTGIAAGNNQNDRFGVARDANIIAIQVFSFIPAWGTIGSYESDTLSGLDYVYSLRNTYPIASANLSLGTPDSFSNFCGTDSRSAVMTNLRDVGIATVVASGNESQCNAVAAPGCIRDAVTVSGTTKSDQEYFFGNWHDEMVNLLAPGSSITSSLGWGDSSYGSNSGTSMSTPHVAGAWAIIKQFDGTLSVDEVLQAFEETGDMISSTRCADRIPKPRINVGAALMSLFSVSPPLNVTAEQNRNRSLLQTEYLNELTWEQNPRNADKNVTHYRIYLQENEQMTFLAEVSSSTFTYQHRKAGKRVERTYGVTAVTAEGEESFPYYYNLKFGVEQ